MHATFDGDGNKGLAGWSRFGERQIRAKKRVDGMQALGLFEFLPYSRATEIFRTAVLTDHPALASGIHLGNLHGLLGSVWAWHILQDTRRVARNGIKGCME